MNSFTTDSSAAFRDKSGYAAFADGEYGAMHVMAHEMLDGGDLRGGHAALGAYLGSRVGAGSCFLHLHWHMLVFEIELGEWNAARRRFLDVLLPAGLESDDVRTDVPSAMWRLALTSPIETSLPWDRVCQAFFSRDRRERTAQTELYDLLLLGGAADIAGLDRFIARDRREFPRWDEGLDTLALALRELALGHHPRAARLLHRAGAELAGLIGSAAQGDLLRQIASAADGAAAARRPALRSTRSLNAAPDNVNARYHVASNA